MKLKSLLGPMPVLKAIALLAAIIIICSFIFIIVVESDNLLTYCKEQGYTGVSLRGPYGDDVCSKVVGFDTSTGNKIYEYGEIQ